MCYVVLFKNNIDEDPDYSYRFEQNLSGSTYITWFQCVLSSIIKKNKKKNR